jgi:SHS2 domain-containing protein
MNVSERSSRPAAGWEHFEHVADVGVRGFGPDPDTAFEQAARAMTAVVCDSGDIRALENVDIRCEAPSLDILLADWLNAVVFEMATRRMLFSTFRVRIDGCRLEASIGGEAVDVARHRPATEVKGATLSELRVSEQPDGGWVAQCILDV